MCIEAVVWNLLHLGESWKCKKCLERLLHAGQFGSRQRFSGSPQSFWFCVATWFFVSRHNSQAAGDYWVATGVFLVVTELFFSCFSVTTGVPTVSQ